MYKVGLCETAQGVCGIMTLEKRLKMKKIRWLIITVLIMVTALAGTVPAFGAADAKEKPPAIDATSAIIMDAETGEILYEKNAYEKRDPASITKILNCLVVLDTLDMDREVTIDYQPEVEGSNMHLHKGETIKIRDLVYGMMIWSANDAAEVLAKLSGGDIKTFCGMMNDRAIACGARDTTYTNPNGLNPSGKVNNRTTAYDIAVVAASAMNNPEFARIVGMDYLRIPATNKYKERKHRSSNRCAWDTKTKVEIDGKKVPLKYDGCIGVKTGYSSTAGDCYCGYAKRGRTSLIVVVLNASHEVPKFRDAINLWNYGFNNYKTYYAARVSDVIGQQKVKHGSLREVDLGVNKNLAMTVAKDYKAADNVTVEINLDQEKIEAPVRRGDLLGEAIAYDENGRELAKQEVISLEDAEEGGILSHIGIADEDAPIFFIALGTLALIMILLKLRGKKRQHRKNRRARNQRAVRRRNREGEPIYFSERKDEPSGEETSGEQNTEDTVEVEKYNRHGRVE